MIVLEKALSGPGDNQLLLGPEVGSEPETQLTIALKRRLADGRSTSPEAAVGAFQSAF